MHALAEAFEKVAKQSDDERRRKDRERKKRRRITPQPHQARVSEKLRRSPGLLVYHGLGSGKSIASINAADELGLDAEVVVPAALRQNYYKEIAKVRPKQRFGVKSYEGFTKNPQAGGKLLVFDEAQRLRTSESKRSQVAQRESPGAAKRLALTGTPIQNAPEEIAPIMNVVSGSRLLPIGAGFREQFVGEEQVNPGLLARLRGVQPGVKFKIKNEGELAKKVEGLVDYHPSSEEGFPSKSHVHVDVPMGSLQYKTYKHVTGRIPKSILSKVQRNLPPSKREAKQLNAFLTAARITSNTPGPYNAKLDSAGAFAESPKMQAIVGQIEQSHAGNPHHKDVVYSNFLEGGVEPVAAALKERGIPYRVFTGGMGDAERKQIVEDYNSGKARVLLISGAGAEGLDLKGTRGVHLMEPHWNLGRTEQVVGRSARFRSHDHLPEEDRHVEVRTYHSTVPRSRLQKLTRRGQKAVGADAYIRSRAEEKQALIDQFHAVLKREGSKHPEKGEEPKEGAA